LRSRSLTLLFTLEAPWRRVSSFLTVAGALLSIAARFTFFAAALVSTPKAYFFYVLVAVIVGLPTLEEETVG
jgi:hypothetical protein